MDSSAHPRNPKRVRYRSDKGSRFALSELVLRKHGRVSWAAPGLISDLCIQMTLTYHELDGKHLRLETCRAHSFSIALCMSGPNLSATYYNTNFVNLYFMKNMMIKHESESNPGPKTVATQNQLDTFIRLIDVKRKCLVKFVNPVPSYLAINFPYCFDNFTKLTISELHRFSIPGSMTLRELPVTARGFWKIADVFGIPYLWIERYCTVFGNAPELAIPPKDILNVYAGAFLTLYCIWTPSEPGGVPGVNRPFVDYGVPDDPEDYYGHCNIWPVWTKRTRPSGMNVSWILKEELVSPRRLYITDYTAIWHVGCSTRTYHHSAWQTRPKVTRKCCSDWIDLILDYASVYASPTSIMSENNHELYDNKSKVLQFLYLHGIENVCGIPTKKLTYYLCWSPMAMDPSDIFDVGPLGVFPSWSWAGFDRTVYWPSTWPRTIPLRCPALHLKTLPRKRPSLMRRMGIPLSLATQITDSHIFLRAKLRSPRESCYWALDDDNADKVSENQKGFMLEMYGSYHKALGIGLDILGLIVENGHSPLSLGYPNIVFVKRIGVFCDRGKPMVRPHLVRPLALIRPMAYESMTRLKSFRLKHRFTKPKPSSKWKRKAAVNQDQTRRFPLPLEQPVSLVPQNGQGLSSAYPRPSNAVGPPGRKRLLSPDSKLSNGLGLKRKRLMSARGVGGTVKGLKWKRAPIQRPVGKAYAHRGPPKDDDGYMTVCLI